MPMRMCMVCRKRAHKHELIRGVNSGGVIAVDKTGKAQSRGFYICPECVALARKKRVLERVSGRRVTDEEYERFTEDAMDILENIETGK